MSTYIDDVAPIIARAPLVPEARNQVFNLGSDTPLTVNRLAEVVAKALGRESHMHCICVRFKAFRIFAVNRLYGPETETMRPVPACGWI